MTNSESSVFVPNPNGCPYLHTDPPGVCNKCGWIKSWITDEMITRAYETFEARITSLAEEKPDSEASVEDWHEAMRAALHAVADFMPRVQIVTPFTPEEIEAALHVAGQSHGSWTSCPRNTRAMCRHFGAYESFSRKLEALANGS